MGHYRKKPVVIEAMRWNGANIDDALAFMSPIEKLPNPDGYIDSGVGHTPALGTLDIPTLEGTMTASAGDWIIKGVKGEFYPCKHDIFIATYEAVDVTQFDGDDYGPGPGDVDDSPEYHALRQFDGDGDG